jgi:hypothetical protein
MRRALRVTRIKMVETVYTQRRKERHWCPFVTVIVRGIVATSPSLLFIARLIAWRAQAVLMAVRSAQGGSSLPSVLTTREGTRRTKHGFEGSVLARLIFNLCSAAGCALSRLLPIPLELKSMLFLRSPIVYRGDHRTYYLLR